MGLVAVISRLWWPGGHSFPGRGWWRLRIVWGHIALPLLTWHIRYSVPNFRFRSRYIWIILGDRKRYNNGGFELDWNLLEMLQWAWRMWDGGRSCQKCSGKRVLLNMMLNTLSQSGRYTTNTDLVLIYKLWKLKGSKDHPLFLVLTWSMSLSWPWWCHPTYLKIMLQRYFRYLGIKMDS